MRRGDDVIYPGAVMYKDSGIDLLTHITLMAMQGMLARTDGGIFNPDEVADKACLQAEAMLRRMP